MKDSKQDLRDLRKKLNIPLVDDSPMVKLLELQDRITEIANRAEEDTIEMKALLSKISIVSFLTGLAFILMSVGLTGVAVVPVISAMIAIGAPLKLFTSKN